MYIAYTAAFYIHYCQLGFVCDKWLSVVSPTLEGRVGKDGVKRGNTGMGIYQG